MYRNIVVALDAHDEESAAWALDHAGQLARAGDAVLHLVYVRLRLPTTYARYLPENWDQDDWSQCLQWLEKKRRSLELPENRVRLHVPQGSIAAEILHLAGEVEAELVILGSHMPSTGTRLFGSNASAVVRDARTSVLVARPSQTRRA